jgi:hypothetical protein
MKEMGILFISRTVAELLLFRIKLDYKRINYYKLNLVDGVAC